MRMAVLATLVSLRALASDPESQPVEGPWRVEVAVAPVAPQVNGLLVEHLGTSAQVAVVVAPHLRLVVAGLVNWSNGLSMLNKELSGVDTLVRVASDGPQVMFNDVVLTAGSESVLSRGRIEAFRFPNRIELSIAGFVGAAASRVMLNPVFVRMNGTRIPATFGDAGWRPVFGTSATLAGRCQVRSFDGVDPDSGYRRSNDVPLALGYVRNPDAEWSSLQVLQVSLGVVF
ncbi:MAG: hypothetical protein JNJ54_00550 [Myxococcaceae bacterium]|nr:hypothetical protein [Myxococcaceae bacterium]